MERQKIRLRELEAQELEINFTAILAAGPPWHSSLKSLAERNLRRRGWSLKRLSARFADFRFRGTLRRTYFGNEWRQKSKPLEWHGWEPRELRAILELAGMTAKQWEEENGVCSGSVSYALHGRKHGPHTQKTITKLATWATSFLEARLKSVKKRKKLPPQ